MCFIETFVTAHTVSEILAEIYRQGPNWTFLTMIRTFREIPHLSYFRIGFVAHQRNEMMVF